MKKKLIAVGMSLLMVMGAGDKNLDQACYSSISYEETLNSVEWKNSHLRAWLNDASDDKSFLNVAFSKEEQEAIITTTVKI